MFILIDSTLRDCVTEFILSEFKIKNMYELNSVIKQQMDTIVDSLVDDITLLIGENNDQYAYKNREFNATLISKHFKIKIYTGISKKIAKNNYMLAEQYFATSFAALEPIEFENDWYRIEVYCYIDGSTIDGLLYIDEIIDIDDINNKFINYVIDNYYSTVDAHGDCYYCYDSNMSNFVLSSENELTNIDFDFISKYSYHQMIHEVVWQWCIFLFLDSLPCDKNSHALSYIENGNNIISLGNRLIDEFYKKINKNRPDKKLPIPLPSLPYTETLQNEITEYNKKQLLAEYKFNYLGDQNANPMFEHMANFIMDHDCTNILDIACGHSRINEFLTGHQYTLTGIDNDPVAVEYANILYQGNNNINIYNGDIMEMVERDTDDNFDCIVISGFLYYMKPGAFKYSPNEFIEKLVEKFSPQYILICEPRPSKSYLTSDLSEVFSSWRYQSKFFDLDIRMGERVVYALHTDTRRSIYERDIVAEFNPDSMHNHRKEPDYDDSLLYNNVYLTNTETLKDVIPSDATHYISVCGGLKCVYQACMDWEPGRDFKMTYIDVVPTALDFRMYFDFLYPKIRNLTDVAKFYKKDINSDVWFAMGEGRHISEANDVLYEQLEYLNIQDKWEDFIQAYNKIDKEYIRIDAVSDISTLNNIIKDDASSKLFWYSNIHDWHQFRYTEEDFAMWKEILLTSNNIKLLGKVPPFTSSP
jgi:hypothetical protein